MNREELLEKVQFKNHEEREELKNYFTQPPDMDRITLENLTPTPVRPMIPTIRPAAAHAAATGRVFRAPSSKARMTRTTRARLGARTEPRAIIKRAVQHAAFEESTPAAIESPMMTRGTTT